MTMPRVFPMGPALPSKRQVGEPNDTFDVLLKKVPCLAPKRVPLRDARGLALAEPGRVEKDVPPFPISTKDGYAFDAAMLAASRSAGGFIELNVIGESSPSDKTPPILPEGGAVRILTGGPLPVGADTVVQQEYTEIRPSDGEGGQRIRISTGIDAARHVSPRGGEFHRGELAGTVGNAIAPDLMAALAIFGQKSVVVYPKPRVALIITGSEHAKDDDNPPSNVPLLQGLIEDAGGYVTETFVVEDELEQLEAVFAKALGADMILSTGGTGPGPKDIVGQCALEYIVLSHWNNNGPGSRAQRARILTDGNRFIPHLGLPGRPLAVVVSFYLFAYPMLRKLAGHNEINARICETRYLSKDQTAPRQPFKPVTLTLDGGDLISAPISDRLSDSFAALLRADGIALFPTQKDSSDTDSTVPVLLMPWRPITHLLVDHR